MPIKNINLHNPSPHVLDLRQVSRDKSVIGKNRGETAAFFQKNRDAKLFIPMGFWGKLENFFISEKGEASKLKSIGKITENKPVISQLFFVNFLQLIGFFIVKIGRGVYNFYDGLASVVLKIISTVVSLAHKFDQFHFARVDMRDAKVLSRIERNGSGSSPGHIEQISKSVEDVYNYQDKENFFIKIVLFWRKNFPRFYYLKTAAIFAIFSLIFILPIKAATYFEELNYKKRLILATAQSAAENLQKGKEAAKAFDISSAAVNFKEAMEGFRAAELELQSINSIVRGVAGWLPESISGIQSAENLLSAGKNISIAADTFSQAFSALNAPSQDNLVASVLSSRDALSAALQPLKAAAVNLAEVNPDVLPADKRDAFLTIKESLTFLQSNADNFLELIDALKEAAGFGGNKKYLFIFQNSNEMRATGGFLGSFAIMDFENGKITRMEVPPGGSYDLAGKLTKKTISPRAIQLINSRFEFQDGNWLPDFPATAQKLEWFYENSGGPTVDGVIAINSRTVEDLLKVLGPMQVSDYDVTLDSANFADVTQRIVEDPAARAARKPKQFIADLMPQFIAQLMSGSASPLNVLSTFADSLNKKDIMFYFDDWLLQKKIEKFGFAGEIRNTTGDYLMVVHSSVAGGKTDGVMENKIEHHAEVQEDGRVIDTVIIRRTHQGEPRHMFTGGRNIDYVRVYVPAGSLLLSSTGFNIIGSDAFEQPQPDYEVDKELAKNEKLVYVDEFSGTEIYESFAKTMFANYIKLDPGETSIVTLKYELPFKIFDSQVNPSANWFSTLENKLKLDTVPYSLLVQKQSGIDAKDFLSSVRLPSNINVVWYYPEYIKMNNSQEYLFTADLTGDKFYGLALQKQYETVK